MNKIRETALEILRVQESESTQKPKSFPNTHEGAIDAFHHLASKSISSMSR
jgi:hypothetical protein